LFELFKFTETNQLFFIGEMIKIAKWKKALKKFPLGLCNLSVNYFTLKVTFLTNFLASSESLSTCLTRLRSTLK
jgi:hypothetical protein